ncbi:MAG TPA: signal peptidase II [bacterium]|nr:signal peptidase II [bacterium]
MLGFACSLAGTSVASRLVPLEGTRVLVPHLLALTLVRNRGIAFGLLAHLSTGATMAIALTVLAALFYNRAAWPAAPAGQWGFGLIVGGAFGNVFDRLRFGYVIDYVDVHVWPVFNVADAAIVVGAGMLVAASLVGRRRGVTE